MEKKNLPKTQEQFAALYNSESDSFGIYKGKVIEVYELNDSYFIDFVSHNKYDNACEVEKFKFIKEYFSKLNRIRQEGFSVTVRTSTCRGWDAKITGLKVKPIEKTFNILSCEFYDIRTFISETLPEKAPHFDFLSSVGFQYVGGEKITMTHNNYNISISLKKDMSVEECYNIIAKSIFESGQERKAAEVRSALGVFDTSGYSMYDFHKYID